MEVSAKPGNLKSQPQEDKKDLLTKQNLGRKDRRHQSRKELGWEGRKRQWVRMEN